MLDKYLLAPYYLTLKLRHALYDKGIIKSSTCEVPGICVGNIAAGGTGKTPHTEMILKTLLESDEWGATNIAVLSRGHKRSSKGFQQVEMNGSASFYGDESVQIKKKFPQVTVAVDRSRVEGCGFLCHPDTIATSKAGRKCKNPDLAPADIVVLDDAFQHRRLKAHFNIILTDYNRPIYKDHLLPFGRLRDLPERLHQADIIIITKCPTYMDGWDKIQCAEKMGIKGYDIDTCMGTDRKGKKVTVLFSCISYCPLTPVYPEGDLHYIHSKKLILFSGIAKDTPLKKYLGDLYKVVSHFKFNDHHKFSLLDIHRICRAARRCPTAVIATTEKDSQRILDSKKVPEAIRKRLFQVPIEVRFLSGREKEVFESTLLGALRSFRSN